jgi:uncharacterized protein YajQ (UPF0234 family)
VQDSNLRRNTPTDLQSAPIGRSGNLPVLQPVRVNSAAEDSAAPAVRINQHRRNFVMADSSFDIVSKIDRQEVDNALSQAARELAQRYDFKGTGAEIKWSGDDAIEISANADDRASAVLDVFKEKLIKRQQSLKILDPSEPRQSGRESKITVALKEGISSEDAKKVGKLIRDEGPKGVKVQVQGDELRVSSKKRDDLQEVIALVKGQDYDFAVQFTNYR